MWKKQQWVLNKGNPCIESRERFEMIIQFNNLLSAVDSPENCTWEKLTPSFTGSPTPRAAHGMCAVGSRLVIFGGRDSVGRKNDIFVLDTGDLIHNIHTLFSPASFHFLSLDHTLTPSSAPNLACYWEKKGEMWALKKLGSKERWKRLHGAKKLIQMQVSVLTVKVNQL